MRGPSAACLPGSLAQFHIGALYAVQGVRRPHLRHYGSFAQSFSLRCHHNARAEHRRQCRVRSGKTSCERSVRQESLVSDSMDADAKRSRLHHSLSVVATLLQHTPKLFVVQRRFSVMCIVGMKQGDSKECKTAAPLDMDEQASIGAKMAARNRCQLSAAPSTKPLKQPRCPCAILLLLAFLEAWRGSTSALCALCKVCEGPASGTMARLLKASVCAATTTLEQNIVASAERVAGRPHASETSARMTSSETTWSPTQHGRQEAILKKSAKLPRLLT